MKTDVLCFKWTQQTWVARMCKSANTVKIFGLGYNIERKIRQIVNNEICLSFYLLYHLTDTYDVTKYSYGVLGKARTLLAVLKRISERTTRFSRKILFLQGRKVRLHFRE